VAHLTEVLRYKSEGRGFDSYGVTGIFHCNNPSGRTMTLDLTQPRTEMITRNISLRDKGGRCKGLTTLPPSCADCLESGEPQSPGTLRVCPGLQWDCFMFTVTSNQHNAVLSTHEKYNMLIHDRCVKDTLSPPLG